MTTLSLEENKHTHTNTQCVVEGRKKATPKVKTSQWSDTKFQKLNSGYFEHFISRLTNVSGFFLLPPGPKFKKSFRILTAKVTS